MKQKAWVLIAIAVVLALALSACERSYSKTPAGSPTAGGDLPFPIPGTDSAIKNVGAGTQTAVASVLGPVAGQTQLANPTSGVILIPTSTPVPPTPTITPTFAIVATATPGLPSTFTVHSGEWPFCIARRFNIDPAELLSANGLSVNSRPEPGAELIIPQGAAKWAAGSRSLIDHPALYTVDAGDTIYSIACEFGDADPNAIIAANSLKEPYTLTAGSTIQVP
jgi:LysM repeat protein